MLNKNIHTQSKKKICWIRFTSFSESTCSWFILSFEFLVKPTFSNNNFLLEQNSRRELMHELIVLSSYTLIIDFQSWIFFQTRTTRIFNHNPKDNCQITLSSFQEVQINFSFWVLQFSWKQITTMTLSLKRYPEISCQVYYMCHIEIVKFEKGTPKSFWLRGQRF